MGDPGSIPGSGRSPGEGNGNPFHYYCLEKSHGLRSLVGYNPWGRKESDTTERLHFTLEYLKQGLPCLILTSHVQHSTLLGACHAVVMVCVCVGGGGNESLCVYSRWNFRVILDEGCRINKDLESRKAKDMWGRNTIFCWSLDIYFFKESDIPKKMYKWPTGTWKQAQHH